MAARQEDLRKEAIEKMSDDEFDREVEALALARISQPTGPLIPMDEAFAD